MSGVFGFVDLDDRMDHASFAAEQAELLRHVPWAVAEWHVDLIYPIAIGRTGIGVFNMDPQPVWDLERRHAIVLAGEVYAVDGNDPDPTQSTEAVLIALYRRYGLDFPRHVDGAFICAIWDLQSQRLLIANDRFGLYPLYFSVQDGRLVFAPEVKAVISAPGFRRELDFAALAQIVRFQQLLGERTFFEDVQQLSPATVLVYELPTRHCYARPYWSFAEIPDRSDIGFDEAVEEAGHLLRESTRRLSSDEHRLGVYLSGGLDSRTLLGLVETRPVHSFTFGVRGCRDVVLAERIARTAGSIHHWFDLPDGTWVIEHVDEHLALTEGFHSWIHSHGISTLDEARTHIDVNLSGWDGGQLLGRPSLLTPQLISPINQNALATHLFHLLNQVWTWPGITEAEERFLYRTDVWEKVSGLALETLREELRAYDQMRPDMRAHFFSARHHCGRLTQNMIAFYRSRFEVRFPFFDYALFDFMHSLPARLRLDRRLYFAVIDRETPRLARIPFDKQEFLPTTNAWLGKPHAAWIKTRNRLNRLAPKAFPAHPTLYADYEGYLRHELRNWAEGILFDRRTADHGLFDPEFIRTLMARHVTGQEQWTIGKIAPLMTYEMMLRRFYDSPEGVVAPTRHHESETP